jgi:hypothetical protein
MISSTSRVKDLRDAFYRLFKSTDPFQAVAQDDLPTRVVLFPTAGYHLADDQFQALQATLKDLNEPEFFISEIEGPTGLFDVNSPWKRGHWECVNPKFEEYAELPIGIENALYSGRGTWGILISHEDHGLLVCQQSFWEIFRRRYTGWEEDVKMFVEYWNDLKHETGLTLEWLAPFLSHLSPSVTLPNAPLDEQ